MKKIAVLVLNNFVNDNRVQKIATSLGQAGHRVTVVALLKGEVPEREQHASFNTHRIRLSTSRLPNKNKFFGALKFLEFIFHVVRHYRSQDIIHCNDFEAMFVGVVAKLTRPSLILVYDCHEYERERTGMNFIKKWSTRIFEPVVIRFARQVFVVSEGIKKEYHRMYPRAKVDLLMNLPHIRSFSNRQVLRNHFHLRDDQHIFLYQGALTMGRGIETLIETFASFTDDRKVVVFMGYGPLTQRIIDAAQKHNTIHYHPAVAYEAIMDYTSGADFGLNTPQNVSKSYYYCLPNKLFEYIHAEIPIITNNLYDCRLLVEKHRIGTVIEEFTPKGIVDAIEAAEQLNRDEIKQRMAQIKATYTWQNEEQKLIAAYASLHA
jgi:glycosyltransferase involved in cell wall biosynthesis